MYYFRARYYSPQLGRFLQSDPIGPKEDLNLYQYCLDDPVGRADKTGNDSFLVARPLDSIVGKAGYGHAYVVDHAKSVGDPKAVIHSYGKLANGNMGSVNDPGRAADVSKPTAQSDAANWKSLSADSANVIKINAPDSVVNAVAGAVKEDRPYSLTPNKKDVTQVGHAYNNTPEVNSNSASFAVADKAQGVSSGNTSSKIDPSSVNLTLPGASAAGKIQFNCTSNLSSAGGC